MSDNEKTLIMQSKTIITAAKVHGFEIVRLISDKGGMADVYEAFQPSVSRRVAAKKLKSTLVNDESVKYRFQEEAKLLGQLNHANIVQVIDFSNEQLTLFLEFIEGRTLDEILSDKGTLPLEESLKVISEVLSGLHYAHSRNIIHRDIKPGNIFLTKEGHVKIADFGIAKIIGGAERAHQTQQGSWVGTPSYISPEQVSGEEISPSADIYSTGVTLYYLTTNKLPFVGENVMQTAIMHLRENPVPPMEINPLISSELNRIILKAMAKSPNERFQTAQEFKEAIDILLHPRKDIAYLKEAKVEWGKSKQDSTLVRKRRLQNSIKLSQMALAENPDLSEAQQILKDSKNDLKKIRLKEYILAGSLVFMSISIIIILILQLSKGSGTLDIDTNEAADVYLDGAKIGTAPFVFTDIKSGRHKLVLDQPGFYRSAEKDIDIEKGKILAISEVIPSGGTVVISSSTPGMTVTIDAQNCGQTPLTKKVIVGRHTIEIGSMKREVIVHENENLTVSF